MPSFLSRLFRRRPPPALSEAQRAFLAAEVPFVAGLPPESRALLEARIPDFLDRTPFEGCDGLAVTEAMRLHVAAQACRLRLGHDDPRYPDLRRVLLYPDDFRVPMRDADEAGIVTEGTEWRSGESWQTGYVVLSWREILYDLRDARDRQRGYQPHLYPARNLVLHEFAHQLDYSYDLTSGIDPDSGEAIKPGPWNEALSDAYIRLDRDPPNRRRPALDDYGAEAPAELFAVAVESYFETPDELKRQYPELHAALGRVVSGEW
jgi:Mlc titration factor MtfA (ptsG expression regulator)